jgi:ribosomal protein L11 methyltransferase
MIRLAIRVRRDEAEIVLAELLELAPSGVEEADLPGDVVEYAVYGSPGELPAVPELTAAAGKALVEVTTSEVPDDWDERWRAFHRPLVLDRLTVRPPWEPAAETPLDVVIDPGRAFGTGAHATTRLCLELMLALSQPDDLGSAHPGEAGCRTRGRPKGPFLDLGCGSGVLAIAAARLGWAPVLALDHDPAAIAACAENARVNGVEIEVRRHDLRTESVDPPATVAANLLGPLLLTWCEQLADGSRIPDRVIASGLLVHEASAVAHAFAGVGLRERTRRERGEWAALLLAR